MGYYIDLTTISLEEYRGILETTELLPSWMILKDNLRENFRLLREQNLRNLGELTEAMNNKRKLQELSENTGLSEEYLSVLHRVLKGYRPKPNRVKDFPCISPEIAGALESRGLKTTLQIYGEILTPAQRSLLSQQTGIAEAEILKLAKLTDLSRIKWVNHTFAFVLLEAGYETARQVADADYREMYRKIKTLNKEKELYKGNIGELDMKRCVDSARTLDTDIQYD